MARHEGLVWGRDIAFTYGPLGSLAFPRTLIQGQDPIPLLWNAAVHLGSAFAVLYILRRVFSLPMSALFGYALLVVATAFGPDMQVALASALLIVLIRKGELSNGWLAGAGALAGNYILVKLGAGIALSVVVLSAALGCRPRGRSVILAMSTMALGVTIPWSLTSGVHSLGALPDFFGLAIESTAQYSAAMALHGSRFIIDLMLGLLAVVTVLLAVKRLSTSSSVTLATTAMLFFAFKQTYVRHDRYHAATIFAICWVLYLSLVAKRDPTRPLLVSALLLTSVVVTGPSAVSSNAVSVTDNMVSLSRQVRTLSSSTTRRETVSKGRTRLRKFYRIPEQALLAMGEEGVHVEPWETSVVWAYGFHWQPAPVFQPYAAYGPSLDALNARSLASEREPARILRSRSQAIDGRWPDFESPEASFTILCHFREIYADERWQVLARSGNRCGPSRHLGTERVQIGQEVVVPDAGDDEIVIGRFGDLSGGLLGRLATATFQGPQVTMVFSGRAYRLISGTAGSAHVLSVPAVAGFSPRFGYGQPIRSFLLQAPKWAMQSFRVSFFAVKIR